MEIKSQLIGCLLGGAIGDSIGLRYEGRKINFCPDLTISGIVSDDTQLTIATCRVIYKQPNISPPLIAKEFLNWFNKGKLSGLGASTLQALKGLQVGGHWALVGRSGEFAAGNGAAMRIAPLAFKPNITHVEIRDVCSITHKNDEAYCGALAIYHCLRLIIEKQWTRDENLLSMVSEKIPDSLVRDRLIELSYITKNKITEVHHYSKPSGHSANSIPLAIFAAQKITEININQIFSDIISIGGDTDTICSLTGQLIGTLKGSDFMEKSFPEIKSLEFYNEIKSYEDSWEF